MYGQRKNHRTEVEEDDGSTGSYGMGLFHNSWFLPPQKKEAILFFGVVLNSCQVLVLFHNCVSPRILPRVLMFYNILSAGHCKKTCCKEVIYAPWTPATKKHDTTALNTLPAFPVGAYLQYTVDIASVDISGYVCKSGTRHRQNYSTNRITVQSIEQILTNK